MLTFLTLRGRVIAAIGNQSWSNEKLEALKRTLRN